MWRWFFHAGLRHAGQGRCQALPVRLAVVMDPPRLRAGAYELIERSWREGKMVRPRLRRLEQHGTGRMLTNRMHGRMSALSTQCFLKRVCFVRCS
jgi:hypothetical protein